MWVGRVAYFHELFGDPDREWLCLFQHMMSRVAWALLSLPARGGRSLEESVWSILGPGIMVHTNHFLSIHWLESSQMVTPICSVRTVVCCGP